MEICNVTEVFNFMPFIELEVVMLFYRFRVFPHTLALPLCTTA